MTSTVVDRTDLSCPLVVLLLLSVFANAANAAAPDTKLTTALAESQRRGVPIFIYVYDSI